MSKAGVDSYNAALFGGMSRLPRPVAHTELGNYQSKMQNGHGSSKKPSKLEQMQADYQQNIMKEKEQKLISLYEENQQRALHKVNQNGNKGIVRDFFQERRAMGSGNSQGHTNKPSIENMFNRKKTEQKLSQQTMGRAQTYNPTQLNGRPPQSNIPVLSQKTSAGRDRSNLLAPIQGPGKTRSPGNPFPNKAQIVRPRTYKDVSLNNANNRVDRSRLPVSAPTGTMMTDSSSDDSPLPNPKQLQMLQQKRKIMKNQMNRNTAARQMPAPPQKKTDFQKFQEEQDQNRANRLKRHRETQNMAQKHQIYQDDEGFDDDSVESDEVDPEEEIKKKQAMLLQQIQNQQRELERLKSERIQEEIQEKKEKARRKKLEEERKRREKEEEEWRRKTEEDERVKRTWEEEKARKIAEEKERFRQTSHTSKYEYEESEDEEERKPPSPPPQRRQPSPPQYKPSAPSKPKPTTTRKYHPPKSRTPPREESPKPQGDFMALYSNADKQEGAFENVGRLVPCYNCGRKFAEDRLEKHEQFCKNATKKRKVLDPTKLRTHGTEMAQYVNTKQSKPKPKKSNWREKHESFMNAIKYAKKCKEIEDQGGSLADLPPPPRSENPDYVQCPHCTRRFNPQTAERHIPHCKNTKSRPGPPPKRR